MTALTLPKSLLAKSWQTLSYASLLLGSYQAQADWTFTASVVSNYLFNGVSQTDKNPAFQPSLNYDFGNGFYAGMWSSNVDYGSGIRLELDGYVGYYTEFSNGVSVDTALNQYTYHGSHEASALNFKEVYAKFNYQGIGLNFWYAWDYFGFGGDHYIVQLNHTFTLNDTWSMYAAVDTSITGDKSAWNWEGKSNFTHAQLMFNTQWQGIDVGIGLHTTTLKERWGDTTVLLTAAKSFSF